MSEQLTADQAVALVQGNPLFHFASMVTIEDKQHTQVRPIPNLLQHRFVAAYLWLRHAGIPIRLLALKPRQKGSSTISAHICYHHARNYQCDGMIIGDEGSRTQKVWQMFCEYSKNDAFPWDSKFKFNTEKANFTYKDGQKGQWEHDTANDPKAGIGGTRQVIWFTEAARYAKSGNRTDVKVITASMNSLAKVPNSLVIAESTPEGAMGWFFETYQNAATLEECQAGRFGNGWVKVFAAWFEFDDAVLKRLPQNERYFDPELSEREKRGKKFYGWTAEQIAWRRAQIENECACDERLFDQDFPEDEVTCFLSSGRPRFHAEGVTRLEEMSKITDRSHKIKLGILEKQGNGVRYVADQPDGWLWVRQQPTPGRSYIGFGDPCTGEQSQGAKNPDAHACGIIGLAYIDEQGVQHNDELVAAIWVPPSGCRWDDTLIAERFTWLSEWYGHCMIVPETGNGLGFINKLKDSGATLYHREKFDRINPGKRLRVIGWETNSATRDIVVNAVADGIRDQSFDCEFGPAVKEMRTFIIDDRGKAQAKSSAHDDWVMGIGIGLACKAFASVFLPRNFSPGSHGYAGSGGYHGWGESNQSGGAFS